MSDDEAHKFKAVELLQVISSKQESPAAKSHGTRIKEEDRSRALAQFSSEPRLRLAITTHFSGELDKEEDVICDVLCRQTSTLVQPLYCSFSASFIPLALKEVMSSVVHGTTGLKMPLHKYVIAANNMMATYHKLGFLEAQLPDLRAPSKYHKLKPYYVHFDLKKYDSEEMALAKPRTFTGEIVNSSLSSAIFAGALSSFVYFIEYMDPGAHLEMLCLCIHTLCHGIKQLEYKVQVIVGKLREELESSSSTHSSFSRAGFSNGNFNGNGTSQASLTAGGEESTSGSHVEESLVQVLVANLVEVYNASNTSTFPVRMSISSGMYSVMSQGILFLCQNVSHPLVLEVCSYAIGMMNERAHLDMNCVGIMLSQCLRDTQVNK